MKPRSIILTVLMFLLVGYSILHFQRCASYDTTRVTINFGTNQNAVVIHKKNLLDKIIDFFLSNAYAKGSPWDPTHTSVIITVTGPGMEKIEASVPPSTTFYTLEIPSGAQRKITVVAFDGTERNTGAHITRDLEPGVEVAVTIQMLPIPTTLYPPYGPGSLAWDFPDAIPGITVDKYVVYESLTSGDDYYYFTETTFNEVSSGLISGRYYRISAVYVIHGEGEPSNPYYNP